jgi:hypothetical protein
MAPSAPPALFPWQGSNWFPAGQKEFILYVRAFCKASWLDLSTHPAKPFGIVQDFRASGFDALKLATIVSDG